MSSARTEEAERDSEHVAPKPVAEDAPSVPTMPMEQFGGAAQPVGAPTAATATLAATSLPNASAHPDTTGQAPSATTATKKNDSSSTVDNSADPEKAAFAKSETSSHTKNASEKGKNGHGKKGDDASSSTDESIDIEDDPELAKLTDQQREIVLRQIQTPKRKPVSFFELWRYATKLEIAFNLLGILTSVVAGALQVSRIVAMCILPD